MEVRFYHLQRSSVDQALPQLLERATGQGMRCVVTVGSEARLAHLDGYLWTYNPASFLGHGSGTDPHAATQPIWLSQKIENPNKASVLFLLDGMEAGEAKDFTLCCDLFDGNDDDAVAAARARWKALKDAGHELTYWQQGDKGWEKKA